MISKRLLNINIFFKLRALLQNYPFQNQKIHSLQLKKLKKLLIHSYNNFDFYKEQFDKAKLNPFKIQSIDEIQKLPIIDNDTYKKFTYSLIKNNPDLYKKYYKDGTSGTTGKPLTIYRTWGERAYMLAKYLRSIFLNGYKIGDITFGLPSPHRITESDSIIQKFGFMRRKCVAYTEPVVKMVNGYLKSNADFLYANKSQLVQMAQYISDNNIKIKKPRMVNCNGEKLDINSKSIIENVFGKNNMFEVYGAVEFNNLAFQVLGKNYFHFNHDTNILELKNNGSIDKKKGNCIITDLHIYSFPLIRYKLGDWIDTEDKNGLQVITEIKGRFDDWISFKDGSKIPFHPFYEVMEKRSMVSQFRFVQENHNLINVYIVMDGGVDKWDFEKKLMFDLKKEISDNIKYNINFVDMISPDPSGKRRMVISKI